MRSIPNHHGRILIALALLKFAPFPIAARMDWCVTDDFKKANHNPIAVLNGDATKRVLEMTAKPGGTVTLSPAGSRDPDGHELTISWFVYREAGTFPGEVKLSTTHGETASLVVPALDAKLKGDATLHIILTVTDRGGPPLTAYRRAVLNLKP